MQGTVGMMMMAQVLAPPPPPPVQTHGNIIDRYVDNSHCTNAFARPAVCAIPLPEPELHGSIICSCQPSS